MKRILIYKIVVPNGEYDLENRVDLSKIVDTVDAGYGAQCPNWGNRVWLQGIVSEIHSDTNRCTLYREDMTDDFINSNYDIIVLPMANFFGKENIARMKEFAGRFAGIKVPTYVIACGVQAKSYDALDELITAIKEPATEFIKAIYKTGGEFALRGYFSKEFFDRLGFHTAVVTGCPSIYQNGRHFRIDKKIVSEDEFRPVLNGEMIGVRRFMEAYPQSRYIDQERYFDLLFRHRNWDDPKKLQKLIRKFGYDPVLYAAQGRVVQFPDSIDWHNYLLEGDFHFSYGSRIHGNIMPILSGIPAVVWAIDSRTREMAEFLNIPVVEDQSKVKNLYELYLETDFSAFNRAYPERFAAFERFVSQCGITDSLNDNNIFWSQNSSDRPLPAFEQPKVAQMLRRNAAMYKLDLLSYRLFRKSQRVIASQLKRK